MKPQGLHKTGLRDACPMDSEFVYQVKKAALGEYIRQIWGWDESFQQQYHRDDFEPSKVQIITYAGKDVGWTRVLRSDERMSILDIYILPEYQNRSIGSFLLRQLLADGRETGIPVVLGVFRINTRARRLYERLGFRVVSETETHYFMEKTS